MVYKKRYKITIIIFTVIFSYWIGFTILVPGSYVIDSIYSEPPVPHCNNHHLNGDEFQKYFPRLSDGYNAGLISPIDAHFLMNKIREDLVLEHIMYDRTFGACFASEDKYYVIWMQLSFAPFAQA